MAKPKFPAAKYIKDVLGSRSPESSVTHSPSETISKDKEKALLIAVIDVLVAQGIDITADYNDWIRIAAALSNAFGEEGRAFFHRVCQNYPGYSADECDKLYTKVFKTNKNLVTLGTFYHLVKEHGVDVEAIFKGLGAKDGAFMPVMPIMPDLPANRLAGLDEGDNPDFIECLKPFTRKIEDQLPEFIRSILCKATSDDEADMMLLSALTIIASALGKKVRGMYDDNWLYATIFLIVVGKAASRKGIIAAMRNLVVPIHEHQRRLFEKEKQDFLANKAKAKDGDASVGEPPKNRMHFIPANSSSAAFFQALVTMTGCGLVVDTEIDTLVQVFKQDWGDFSKLLRKTFHHESDEVYRKTNDEYYYIEEPAESMLLSGTMQQFLNLIPNVENGLFSRYLIFMKKPELGWRTIKNSEDSVDKRTYFYNLGKRLFRFYEELQALDEPITFDLTEEQWCKFNNKFEELYNTLIILEGEDIHASIVRFGSITFRIMMVLTMLRVMTSGKEIPQLVYCSDKDFDSAFHITQSCIPHMAQFFEYLEPVKKTPQKARPVFNRDDMNALYLALPDSFTTAEYLRIASEKFGIPSNTASKWLEPWVFKGVVARVKQGCYKKLIKA